MNIKTRHIALILYTAIAIMIIMKDLITDTQQLIILLAPIAGAFAWDKIEKEVLMRKGKE